MVCDTAAGKCGLHAVSLCFLGQLTQQLPSLSTHLSNAGVPNTSPCTALGPGTPRSRECCWKASADCTQQQHSRQVVELSIHDARSLRVLQWGVFCLGQQPAWLLGWQMMQGECCSLCAKLFKPLAHLATCPDRLL